MININVECTLAQLHDFNQDDQKSIRYASAEGVKECMVDHLSALPGRSFYAKTASSIEHQSQEKAEILRITQRGFALQYYGGIVKAGKGKSHKTGKRTKFLSIPVSKSGSRLSIFYNDLSFIKLSGGRGALVRFEGEGKNKSFNPVFWLVKQATIKSHPKILPTQPELDDAAEEYAEDEIYYILDKQTP